MAFTLDRKYLVGLTIGLLCIGALIVLGLQTFGRLSDSLALADHTRNAQSRVKDVTATMLDLQTSQRGYLLTRAAPDLDPYRRASARLDAELGPLTEVTADHPEQWSDLARLKALIDQKRAELARSIALADKQAVGATPAVGVDMGDGKAIMDDIRTVLARMEREEARAMAQHEAAEAASLRQNIFVAAALVALMAGLLGAISVQMRREQAMWRRAELAEAESMKVLEQRVEERTRELEQASRALNLSEARLRGIFDSATDAIVTADESQTVVMANPAAATMFRCPIGELVGAPLEQFVPQRYRAEHRRHVEDFGATEISARPMARRPDVTGLRCDGEEFPIDASISSLYVGGQRLYTVILRDITERRYAEAALHESETRLRRLLTLLPEAVIVTSGNRISFVNEAAQFLFGAGEAALLGRSTLELFHPDSVELVKSRIAALQGGALFVPLVEEKIVRADGATCFVEATATLVEDRGEVSILTVMRDVTGLKQVRAALDRSHRDLQQLVAAQVSIQENERRRIARELHDDLQQKLASIRIDVAVVMQRLAADPEGVAALLAAVDNLAAAAIDSTRRIVNDLRPEILDDLGLVPALQALAQQFNQRTGIACDVEAQGDAGAVTRQWPAIATCLYRVAQESLNNVAKHAQANAVQVQLAITADERVVLCISDNGDGISADDRHKPHSFGLLGMHERLRALGGVLRIASQPGAGTTVEAEVPVAEVALSAVN